MTTPKPLRHIPSLDGLRGLAVLGVVAFHTDHLVGGFLGVDLFFVLSGFLISRLLVTEQAATARTDLRRFWSRRARRLVPALFLLIATMLLYALFLASPYEMDSLRRQMLATLMYLANWNAIADGTDYWARAAGPSPLQHTWSLAIEEQFYVLWPLVVSGVFALSRRKDPDRVRGIRRLLVLCLTLAAASSALMIAGSVAGTNPTRLYFGSDTRVSSILIGASFACFLELRGPFTGARARWVLEAAAGASLIGLGVAWTFLDGQNPILYRGGFAACAVGAVIVIAAVTHPEEGPIAQVLATPVLAWFGTISYGLYLWHWPIIQILDEARTGLDGLPLLTLWVGASIGVAALSFYCVEQPIRLGRLISTKEAWAALPATAVMLVVLTGVVVQPPPVSLDEVLRPIPVPPALTERLGEGARPRMLIVGDSVGRSVAGGLVGFADRTGVDAVSLATAGCSVSRRTLPFRFPDGTTAPGSDECGPVIDSWAREIDEFRPDVVALILGWPGGLELELDGVWRRPCDPEFRSWQESQVRAAVDVLLGTGVPLVITNVPYLGPGPHPATDIDRDAECLNDLYTDIVNSLPGVDMIDLAGWVCPGNTCLESIEGHVFRPDGLHFRDESSVLAGHWIAEQALAFAASAG